MFFYENSYYFKSPHISRDLTGNGLGVIPLLWPALAIGGSFIAGEYLGSKKEGSLAESIGETAGKTAGKTISSFISESWPILLLAVASFLVIAEKR